MRRLVADNIESVSQLDVLLLLQRRPEDAFTPQEAARVLHSQPEVAEGTLSKLTRAGIVAVEIGEDGIPCFRYRPTSAAAAKAVEQLAEWYRTHRSTVIALIFSSPEDRAQGFADAFRLRGDE